MGLRHKDLVGWKNRGYPIGDYHHECDTPDAPVGTKAEYGQAKGSQMELNHLEKKAEQASALLKAMSNQSRLMILCQLNEGEKSVGELERIVGLSQSALSQHLARLRRDKLVKTRREAQTIFYSLQGDEAVTVIKTLYDLYCRDDSSAVAA